MTEEHEEPRPSEHESTPEGADRRRRAGDTLLRDSIAALREDVSLLTEVTNNLRATISMFVRTEEMQDEVARCVHEELEPRVDELEAGWERKLSRRGAVLSVGALILLLLIGSNFALVQQQAAIERDRSEAIAEALVVACGEVRTVQDALRGVLFVLAAPREDDGPGDLERREELLAQSLAVLEEEPCPDVPDVID